MDLGRRLLPLRSERWPVPFAVLLLAAAYAVAMAPLHRAWFTDDDWHFLALLRHIDAATDVFTQHFMGSYGYRPVAVMLFAATVSWFGPDPVPHYVVNVVLHGAVALLLWRLALALAAPRGLSASLASAFLLVPVTQATPLWISNRFDLLATAMCLLALLHALRWLTNRGNGRFDAVASVLALLLGAGCKETALAMVPALLLLLVVYPVTARDRRQRTVLALIFLGIAAAYWLARSHAVGEAGSVVPNLVLAEGIGRWGRGVASLLLQPHVFVGTALLFAALLLIRRPVHRRRRAASEAMRLGAKARQAVGAALLVLLAGLVVLQAPVAATALGVAVSTATGEPFAMPLVSQRFYYVPAAVGVLLPATLDWSSRQAGLRFGWTGALVVAALAAFALGARSQSERWSEATGGARQTYRSLQTEVTGRLDAAFALAQKTGESAACVADLTGARGPNRMALPDYGLPIDLIVKAHLPKGDPRVNCVLVTEPPQAMSITRLQPCIQAVLPGLRPSHPAMIPFFRSGTCTFFAQTAASPL